MLRRKYISSQLTRWRDGFGSIRYRFRCIIEAMTWILNYSLRWSVSSVDWWNSGQHAIIGISILKPINNKRLALFPGSKCFIGIITRSQIRSDKYPSAYRKYATTICPRDKTAMTMKWFEVTKAAEWQENLLTAVDLTEAFVRRKLLHSLLLPDRVHILFSSE